MTTDRRHASSSTTAGRGGSGSRFRLIGVGLAVAVCCGLPVLLAGGVLAAVGGVVGNPVVILAGLAVGAGFWRNRRRDGGATCPRSKDHISS